MNSKRCSNRWGSRAQSRPIGTGAWKVAYADFVTAMMALFIVLWLTSQDKRIKEAVERSFKQPFASLTKDSTGIIPLKETESLRSRQGNFSSASVVELNILRRLSEDLLKVLQQENDIDTPMQLDMRPDGLRINVFDKVRRPIFKGGTAEFTDYGRWIFTTLAWQVARYPKHFLIELEGHTEKCVHAPDTAYTGWELTADRANSARRLLEEHGVVSSQMRKVAGFADTQPLADLDLNDERNRRVSLLLRANGQLD
jgi:chemotaxis protein MotB